ncbi:MAG: SLC13 family permease [Planctomycetes bacterium]|jgi:di/tricarboxylate transporter|nr:SLC13 family permease [Planctomycetota bacterium]
MTWEAWLTIGVVVFVLAALWRNWAQPDIIMAGALTLLMAAGMISGSPRLPDPREAVAGFGNAGPITVGVLFIVVQGLVRTGATERLTRPFLGLPKTPLGAQGRMILPVTTLSAFLNNTPIVAMFMPVMTDWARKTGISPSRLFIPLSYASIFGGICTLIGTSTNLVIAGMVLADDTLPAVGMFDIALIGLPCAAVGIVYLLLVGRWLLPDRKPALSLGTDPRQYTVEMIVEPDGPLVGKTIEQAGLRHLPGLYLAEIDRDGAVLPAVAPDRRLDTGDRLVFVGIVESVVDLRKIRGLAPATDQVFKLAAGPTGRCLVEAVVSRDCPLLGQSIREGRFRSVYDAVVVAVARHGERLQQKIGDIELQAGDTLLLETSREFADRQRNSRDFYLVSALDGSAPMRHERAPMALAILVAMVATVTVGWLNMLTAAMLAAGLMLITRCCTGNEARQSVDWRVLVVIGAALGVGRAMQTSGAADGMARSLIGLAGERPWLVLAAVYAVTTLFTELITNNAAAVLVYPIAVASARTLGVNPMAFVFCIMVAASASFATPIGYQTNLMVYGPGGYRFSDYLRIGLPLNLLMLAVAVGLAPLIWPF